MASSRLGHLVVIHLWYLVGFQIHILVFIRWSLDLPLRTRLDLLSALPGLS